MIETQLFTRDHEYVTTVYIPPFNPPAEVIAWGQRFFIRQPGGDYCEGLVYVVPIYDRDTP